MSADFPAAHSMDTEWFAVDDQGQVALFYSGEAGAVPKVYQTLIGGQYSLHDVIENLVGCANEIPGLEFYVEDLTTDADGAIFFRDRWETPWDEPFTNSNKTSLADLPDSIWDCLVWFRDEADLSKIKAKHLRMPTQNHVFAWFQEWKSTELKRLHKQGAICRAWLNEFSLERFGFYSFEHADNCENWISGPYVKTSEPVFPLFVSQLPGRFRALLETVRLEGVDFSETSRIQPVEHSPCNSWQPDWQDLAGEQHEFERNADNDA